ncbi:hypothetical protein T439DRAFT_376603 [Meredithblackwellia eburnea MCA 4105]
MNSQHPSPLFSRPPSPVLDLDVEFEPTRRRRTVMTASSSTLSTLFSVLSTSTSASSVPTLCTKHESLRSSLAPCFVTSITATGLLSLTDAAQLSEMNSSTCSSPTEDSNNSNGSYFFPRNANQTSVVARDTEAQDEHDSPTSSQTPWSSTTINSSQPYSHSDLLPPNASPSFTPSTPESTTTSAAFHHTHPRVRNVRRPKPSRPPIQFEPVRPCSCWIPNRHDHESDSSDSEEDEGVKRGEGSTSDRQMRNAEQEGDQGETECYLPARNVVRAVERRTLFLRGATIRGCGF